MFVTDLKQGDYDHFKRLLGAFFAYAGNECLEEKLVRELFEKSLERGSNFTVLLGWIDDVPAGMISITIAESSYRAAPFAWLDDFFIEPDFRKRGLGRALLEAATRFARERHCSNILVGVGDDEMRAQTFYSRYGFKDMECRLFTLPLFQEDTEP